MQTPSSQVVHTYPEDLPHDIRRCTCLQAVHARNGIRPRPRGIFRHVGLDRPDVSDIVGPLLLLLFDHFRCKLEGRVDQDDRDLSGYRQGGYKDSSEGSAHGMPDDSVVVCFGQVRFHVFGQRAQMEVARSRPESVPQECGSDDEGP